MALESSEEESGTKDRFAAVMDSIRESKMTPGAAAELFELAPALDSVPKSARLQVLAL